MKRPISANCLIFFLHWETPFFNCLPRDRSHQTRFLEQEASFLNCLRRSRWHRTRFLQRRLFESFTKGPISPNALSAFRGAFFNCLWRGWSQRTGFVFFLFYCIERHLLWIVYKEADHNARFASRGTFLNCLRRGRSHQTRFLLRETLIFYCLWRGWSHRTLFFCFCFLFFLHQEAPFLNCLQRGRPYRTWFLHLEAPFMNGLRRGQF